MIESEQKGRVVTMRRVRCYECGKMYDFDTDDFCPRCGAFNQPPKSTAIDANGSVIRVEGINEKNHAGSFVHEELHEENRERRRMGLSKSARQAAKPRQSWQSQSSAKGKTGKTNWVFWLVAVIVGLNILCSVLSSLFGYFLYW